MGFEVRIDHDRLTIGPAAVCDAAGCGRSAGPDATVVYPVRAGGGVAGEEVFVSCCLECQEAIRRGVEGHDGDPPQNWGVMPLALYVLSVAHDVGALPPDLARRVEELVAGQGGKFLD